jgi:Uma2 family endonuclease
MSTLLTPPSHVYTLADLLDQLGGISPARVLMRPAPGTATEADLLQLKQREDRLYELVDGVLVEKAMSFRESCLAGALLAWLRAFVMPRNLGLVSGADGSMRLFPGLVRIPDVAFVSWNRLPDRRMPSAPIPDLVPNLAVKVLSESNTPAEMDRKRREYFAAGVELLWVIDPVGRTVTVYTPLDRPDAVLTENETLVGGNVLPGFSLSLRELFADLDRQGS